MTAKLDKTDEPEAAKRPKLKKETLKDLEATPEQARDARGGRPTRNNCTERLSGCIS